MQTLLVLLSLLPVESAPIHAETMTWEATPTSRGTITILFSCVAALCLCVWTGVHLNVEPIEHRRKKMGSQFLGKSIWALIALYAPDIVLSVALHQFLVAWEYRRAVNDRSKEKAVLAGDDPPKEMKFGMAFFAVMGGFCGEVNTVHGPRWDSLGVVTLCHWRTMDSIREYSLLDIKDKSKASAIAKTVACIQTGWLLLQCVGRQAEDLHITLLELNTSVHVIIAIAMYGIWWEKPLDIRRSIPFDRSRLGIENSPATVYVDTVRSALERAEEEVACLVRPNSETKVKTEDAVAGPNSKTVINTEEPAAHPAILAAVSILRSIRGAPEEAGRLFRIVPNAIRSYFQKVVRADIRHAVWQNYKRSATVSTSASQAAYVAAFAVASEIAFEVAHKQIFSTVYKLAADGVNSEKGLKEFEKILENAYEATRKATFKKSFGAAFAAVVVETGRQNTNSSLGSAIKQPTPSGTTPSGTQPSVTPHVSLLASFRAANSAARSASRHAVRLVAFDAALGIAAAKNAATVAVATEFCHDYGKLSEPIKADIKSATTQICEVRGDPVRARIFKEATEKAREEAGKALSEQFHTSGPRVSSNVGSAVAIVKRSTSTGVFFAARDAIQKAKAEESKDNQRAYDAYDKAEEELRAIEPEENGSKWQRLCATAHDVVGDQIITVPGLFAPPEETEIIRHIEGNNSESQSDEAAGNKMVFRSSWRRLHRTILIFFSAVVGAFYGTIHATRWNSSWFPTNAEHRLWQISCAVGSAAMIPTAISLLAPFIQNNRLKHLAMIICAVCWVAFILARMYLVFESFLSLRSLPWDAFKAVRWADAIPHF
jgi:hypothetical protein